MNLEENTFSNGGIKTVSKHNERATCKHKNSHDQEWRDSPYRDSCFQSFKKTGIDFQLSETKTPLEFFHNTFFLSGQKTLSTSVQLLMFCLSSCSKSTLKEEIVIKPEVLPVVGSPSA